MLITPKIASEIILLFNFETPYFLSEKIIGISINLKFLNMLYISFQSEMHIL